MADQHVQLKDGTDNIYPVSLHWKNGESWESIENDSYLINALNYISSQVATMEARTQNKLDNISSSGGPVYTAIVFKLSDIYYSGILWSYNGLYLLFSRSNARYSSKHL